MEDPWNKDAFSPCPAIRKQFKSSMKQLLKGTTDDGTREKALAAIAVLQAQGK